jgi:hypothetical protein
MDFVGRLDQLGDLVENQRGYVIVSITYMRSNLERLTKSNNRGPIIFPACSVERQHGTHTGG